MIKYQKIDEYRVMRLWVDEMPEDGGISTNTIIKEYDANANVNSDVRADCGQSIESEIQIKKGNSNREFYLVMYLFTGLFILMPCYLGYFLLAESKEVVNNPYNLRQEEFAKKVVRGSILSADGEILAETKVEADGTEVREYPFGNLFSHVVGYSQSGKDGLEKIYNFQLLTSDAPIYEKIAAEVKGEK